MRQDFGTVEVEAEVKETNHLTVETPYLAAVVKGTHFIVTADETGASVEVTRGLVAVEAAETKQSTSVEAGNVARVEPKGAMWVTGSAPVPKLFDGQGLEIPMPAMGRSAAAPPRRAPAISGASDTTQVAMNSPSAGVGAPLQMAGGGDTSTTAAPAQGGGLDIATAGIGIALGIMLGSLGLLFRRLFR